MKLIKRFYWIILSIVLVLIDQLTKFWIVKTIPINDSKVLISDFFSLTHVRNTGAAFGMLSNQRWIFMLFTSVVLIAAMVALCSGRVKNHWGVISLSLIIGGGVGNMIDRIALGEVVDFFAFNFWGYQFAVFNVADVFVCCGTAILAFYIFFSQDFNETRSAEDLSNGAD
ncbi:MAG: signal peptidase II [Clostridia bacterium]|nr:signal peptidase II [Clostridia bacterium]